MRVIVIGGHGKVASHLERMLAERGHEVRAVIRNPDHRDDVVATGAEPVVADVEELSVDEMAELLADHDAVVWSAGAGGGNPAAPERSIARRRCARWTPQPRPTSTAT